MMLPFDRVVLHVAVVAMFVDVVMASITLRSLINRLKSEHRATWIMLGSPNALLSAFSPWSRLSPAAIGFDQNNLGSWLSSRSYVDLKDSKLTALARLREWVKRIGVALVIALIAYAVVRALGFTFAPNFPG
jgi:hypothetical protein